MKQNKDYRGQFTTGQINAILDLTRISENNRKEMIRYFVDGVRLKDLTISKQAATTRIKKVINLIE